MSNSNDIIRDIILRELHEVYVSARSVKATAIGIRDLQQRIRQKHGFKQHEVASNLTYLIQKGWAQEVVEERTFTTGGTTRSAPRTSYRISDVGIDRPERASAFSPREETPHTISITNIHGVTVVGDQNAVNTQFTDASRTLAELRLAILSTEDLSEQQKLESASDIEAILAQLQKPEPDRTVVRTLWENVEKIAAVGQIASLAAEAAKALAPLIS